MAHSAFEEATTTPGRWPTSSTQSESRTPDGNATRVAGQNRLGYVDESRPPGTVPPRTPTSGHEQRRDAGVLLEFEAGTADGQRDGLERPDV